MMMPKQPTTTGEATNAPAKPMRFARITAR